MTCAEHESKRYYDVDLGQKPFRGIKRVIRKLRYPIHSPNTELCFELVYREVIHQRDWLRVERKWNRKFNKRYPYPYESPIGQRAIEMHLPF